MLGRFIQSSGTAASLGRWADLVDPAESPFQSMEPEHAFIEGRLVRREIDRTNADLIEVSATKHTATRTPEHIRSTPERLCLVTVQLHGSGTFTQLRTGASTRLTPGSIVFWTSEVPYRWDHDGDFSLLMVRFPVAALQLAPAQIRELVGAEIRADSGHAARVVRFALDAVQDTELMNGPTGIRALQNLVDLFGTLLAGALEIEPDRAQSAPVFRRVIAYIHEHLDSDDLDVATIAAANRVSTRYLQSIFAERGTSVSAWVRSRRLEAVRRMLADPAHSGDSIGVLCAAAGFTGQGSFSRMFREAYGETPSAWRQRAFAEFSSSGTGADRGAAERPPTG